MSHQYLKTKASIRSYVLASASLLSVGAAVILIQGSATAAPMIACGDMGQVTSNSVCSMSPGEVIGYTARGADGGQSDTGAAGGLGGMVTGTFANETADTLTITIRVGLDGADGASAGGGGGGFTALQIGEGWDIEDAIVVAGGGGGGGLYSDPGGNGGSDAADPTGGGNGGDECCDPGFDGGSGSTGGTGGVGTEVENDGGDGGDVGQLGETTTRVDDSNGNGGDGGDGYRDGGTGGEAEDWAGGGGAGYAGGGGGGAYNSEEGGAGGGGSSYFTGDAVGVDPATLTGAQVVFTRLPSIEVTTTTVEETTTTVEETTTTGDSTSTTEADELANSGAGDVNRVVAFALVLLGVGCAVFAVRGRRKLI